MIDEDRTEDLFGYKSTDWAPKSDKKIVCICEGCGKVRIIDKNQYRDLCKKCVKRTPEAREKARQIKVQYYIDHPEAGKEHSKKLIQYYIDRPEKRKIKSDQMIQYYIDHPERIKDHIQYLNNYYTEEIRKIHSQRMIQYYIDNPDKIKDKSKQRIQYFKDHPEECDLHSEQMIQYFKDHPEITERHSAFMQGQDYDLGEWTGFVDNGRNHLIPTALCLHLNPKFEGCEGHHIMSGVVINLPIDLHMSIRHRTPTENRKGKNMEKINTIALNYLLGIP